MAAAPFIANFEGWRNTVYGDSLAKGSHELVTVCAGHTDNIGTQQITKTHYTDDECTAIEIKDIQATDRQVVAILGPSVVESMPISRRVAIDDFTFNLGAGSLKKSKIPRLLQTGQWPAACMALLAYDKATVNHQLVVIEGLHRRRQAEFDQCMKQ